MPCPLGLRKQTLNYVNVTTGTAFSPSIFTILEVIDNVTLWAWYKEGIDQIFWSTVHWKEKLSSAIKCESQKALNILGDDEREMLFSEKQNSLLSIPRSKKTSSASSLPPCF